MHVGSSKRFAKKIKYFVSELKDDFEGIDEFKEVFKDAIESKNVDTVKKVFDHFLKECLHSEDSIEGIKKGESIIEHRLIKHLQAVQKELSDVKGLINGDSKVELESDYNKIEKIFSNIIESLKKEKIKAKDLRLDRDKLRDKSVLTDAMIFHILKIAARHEKTDTIKEKKEEKKVLDDLHEMIKNLKESSNEVKASDVKKLGNDLEKFEKSITDEFKEALKIEDELIVISFRLEEVNKEGLHALHELVKMGFQEDYIRNIDVEEEKFVSKLNEDNRRDYNNARALLGESK